MQIERSIACARARRERARGGCVVTGVVTGDAGDTATRGLRHASALSRSFKLLAYAMRALPLLKPARSQWL